MYSTFVVIVFVDLFRFLTSGMRALFLGRHCGQIFFIFADFVFGAKNDVCDILEVFDIFL
jgi:hypothetical protein